MVDVNISMSVFWYGHEGTICLIDHMSQKVVIAPSHYLQEADPNIINGASPGTKYDACASPVLCNADYQISPLLS